MAAGGQTQTNQPERRQEFAPPHGRTGARLRGRGQQRQTEHGVRGHHAEHRAGQLCQHITKRFARRQIALDQVRQRDDRIEMTA
jgi:hypothetical protein